MVEEKESKIPVFTVIKNGAILKNIFVINKPQQDTNEQQESETLIIGRHPDCNIMLTHPSISRFHLQIHSKPSSQKLTVIDLSSVHGTWVSGNKIDPGVVVELNEGDTIKIGGSTRVYKLHWIPLSSAYDMENQFVCTIEEEKEEDTALESHEGIDMLSTEIECAEEKDTLVVEKEEEEPSQSLVPAEEEELFSMDWILESLASLFCDGSSAIDDDDDGETENPWRNNSLEKRQLSSSLSGELSLAVESPSEFRNMKSSGLVMKKEIPSAPPMPENMNSSIFDDDDDDETENPWRNSLGKRELSSNISWDLSLVVESPSEPQNMKILPRNSDPSFAKQLETFSATEIVEETVNKRSSQESEQKIDVSTEPCLMESTKSTFQEDDIFLNMINSQQVHENQISNPVSATEIVEETVNRRSSEESEQKIDVSTEPCLMESTKSTFQEDDIFLNMINSQQVHENQVSNPVSATEIVEETVNRRSSEESEQKIDVSTEPCLMESTKSTFQEDDIFLNMINSQQVHENQISNPVSATEIVEETVNRRSSEESEQKIDVSTEPCLMESTKSTFQEDDIFLNMINSQQVHENQIFNPVSALKPIEEMENKENAAVLQEEDYESENTSFYSASLATESVDSSLCIVEDDKRDPTPQSGFAPLVLSERGSSLRSSPLRLETKSNSIWSRRGKPASVFQLQTGKADAENNKAVPKSLFVSSDEEEIYTPDKENFTPNTLLMRALKRKGKLDETKHSSSKVTPHLQLEDNINASDKENQTPKLMKSIRKASRKQPKSEQDMMIKGKTERAPFQSLLVESARKTVSEASVRNHTARCWKSKNIEKRIAYPSLNNSVGEPRRTWTMVADTTSLMDKESRKSLKLLQGLKGTRLIIPRTVIRELDCLKQRGSLFRRKSEASSVSEWIEECMLNTKWWIHVQNTMEERGPIAPTPPATPHSHFTGNSSGNSFGPFSAGGSLMEIATPTAEDHILDYALLCRKMKGGGNGHLVLLSNDVTLKIKAMAEGLICETVQEFWDSLVNPFSERFMWADSSPRGQTWSVKDDVVLRDKYNRYPLKKPSKGDTKGLKLILLHNSHYGQINSIR